jgi:minor extracellular serine protease Vpr
MRVINMSIGSSYQWPQYPTAAAASRLVKKGVVVVASIGNSGGVVTNGWSAGAPGTGANVIGVASFDNDYTHQPAIAVNGVNYGYDTASGAPPPPTSGSFPLARIDTKTTTNAGCAAMAAGSLTGQVALIRRGTCSFFLKASNAMNAGAAGVVLYNNVAGALSPTVAGTPAITIPVVALSAADGNAIDDLLAIGPQNMTWTGQTVDKPQATGGLISSFSSWGLAADLSLKPDIGAPGGSIRSTYPLEYGSYASISGTSMSSPHVAGGVALLLQAKPKTKADDVRDILQNSAIPSLWSAAPGYGILDATHRQGAGMLNIPGAVQATTRVEPGKLSLGESQFGAVKRSLRITNSGANAETYDWLGTSSVVFSREGTPVTSITIPGRGSARLDVSIAPDADLGNLDDLAQYGGYITFTPHGASNVVTVPVAGFKGDYQALQVLAPTANGFPWLASTSNGITFTNKPAGATYTMVGLDQPNIAAHFDHQSRKVRFEVFDTNGKSWYRAFPDFDYFGMNSSASGFFAFAWDGTTVPGDGRGHDDKNAPKARIVPNGSYVIKLSVLKALGDDDDPAHWETWTSPVITIARP